MVICLHPIPVLHNMESVLVVEDEKPMRSLLERWLKSSGYFPQVAESAVEALGVACCGAPAVAICDLLMPGHDGAWLARQLRARYPDTALIVATGVANPHELGDLPHGIVEYLFKPFTRARFNDAVERGFTWHRASGTRRWNEQLAEEQWTRSRLLHEQWQTLDVPSHGGVEAAVGAIMANEPRTFDHSVRVSRLAALMCRKLGLPGEEIEAIERAALLHDIGKLAMPEAILIKPAPLTAVERDIIRAHPDVAYQFVKDHPLLGAVADLVRGVTECYGGGGYPTGLTGHEIPLGSRIIAVADAYDTMTHARAYRDATTPAQAAIELLRCAGSQFDPDIVTVFLDAVATH
jgi:putative nucleotidyltransferase with HDIG domain